MGAVIRQLLVWSFLVALTLLPSSTSGVKAESSEWLAGKLLIAAPAMTDPRFVESVIYMVEHDETGAMGLIVNHPLGETSASRLLEQLGVPPPLPDGKIRVHTGGPVQPELGFVLHSTDKLLEDSLTLDGGLALTNDPAMLRAIAAGEGPSRALFMLGYSGWGPGQLESEIAVGAWDSVPLDKMLVFDEADEQKWKLATDRQGIEL